MVRALLSIDYTVDFVADQGKLTAGKSAQAIEDKITELTRTAYEAGDYLFFMIDCHQEEDSFHPESRLFPPHNLEGSPGRELFGKLAELYREIAEDSRVFWMDKRHYSAFSGTDLDIRLRERKVDTILLTGVLSDICILHTAIDAYNLGYQIEVSRSAIAALTDQAHQFALAHFEGVLGAKLID